MSGIWVFLIVAVVFGSITSVVQTALRRGQAGQTQRELEVLRGRIAQLEGRGDTRAALPSHEAYVRELERRVEALETIVTGADHALEDRLREAAVQHLDRED